jgi:hypothetical protein
MYVKHTELHNFIEHVSPELVVSWFRLLAHTHTYIDV